MSDETPSKDQKETIQAGSLPNMPVTVHAQYIKDISFENPNAPNSLRPSQEKPSVEVNISLDATKLEDPELKSLYEVTLGITAKSTRADKVEFIAEASYAAAVSLHEVNEENHHPLLFIEIPQQIFPWVRQSIAQLTQGGGYAPLFLQPVDFRQMYVNRFSQTPAA